MRKLGAAVVLAIFGGAALAAEDWPEIRGKGRLAVGFDADLTVVDMKRTETITHNWIQSRSRWTPYDGVQVKGWPVGTFVRGRCVAWNGEILGPADGEPVRFLEV